MTIWTDVESKEGGTVISLVLAREPANAVTFLTPDMPRTLNKALSIVASFYVRNCDQPGFGSCSKFQETPTSQYFWKPASHSSLDTLGLARAASRKI